LLSGEKSVREQEDEQKDAGATHGSTPPDSQAGIRVLPSYPVVQQRQRERML
jgi:hypothetical protein